MIIDVSYANGVIDWDKAKNDIDGVIIRAGYGKNFYNQDDAFFKRNADECTRLGIPFGLYLYSYAKDEAAALSEAKHVLRLAEDYALSYPIYYDLEENCVIPNVKKYAEIFADEIEKAGYWCGIYSSSYWFSNYLKGFNRCTKWVAAWGKNDGKPGTKPKDCDMWQYTSKGTVSGIRTAVDCNLCYKDFPSLFKETFTAGEARKAIREALGIESPDISKHDLDGDGKVTAADAREILRKSLEV